MTAIEQFDKWYNQLSQLEKSELISHIISSKLQVCNEGFYTGPTGNMLTKGLYTGPAGQLVSNLCPRCGK